MRAILLLLTATLALGAAELWQHDLAAAQAQAQSEGKDLLVLFTGSDWCQYCKLLEREVLKKDVFKQAAPERFVLVELDFPRKKQLPEDQAAANQAAKERYAIRGFPTVALLRPDGTRYAATGYKRMKPDAYIAHLDELIAARDRGPELEAAVAAAEGVAKARAWHALIEHRDLVRDEVAIADLEALLAADPDDATGLRAGYEARLARERRSEAMSQAREAEDLDQQRALIAEGIADPMQDAEYRQGMHYRLGFLELRAENKAACVASFQAAIDAAPKSRRVKQIRMMRDAIKRQLEAEAK